MIIYYVLFVNGGNMKKIIAINGSPHKQGCTAVLMDEIVESCGEHGADVKTYNLSGMDIKGCIGCGGCVKEGKCVIDDDMQLLYEEIEEADGIIMASPVYFWQITSQLKAVIDRLQPFGRPNSTTEIKCGKKLVVAATQGRPDPEAFVPYFEHFAKSLGLIGCDQYELLIAGGTHEPEDVLKQEEVLEKAKQLGGWLAE